MEKLLKVKEWLILEDVAKRLSISFDEEVTAKDVLHLCLQEVLQLSIYLSRDTVAQENEYCPVIADEPYRRIARMKLLIVGFEDECTQEEVACISDLSQKLFEAEYKSGVVYIETSENMEISGVYQIKIAGDKRLKHAMSREYILGSTSDKSMYRIPLDTDLDILYANNGWCVTDREGVIYRMLTGSIDRGWEKGSYYYPEDTLPPIDDFVIQTYDLIAFEKAMLDKHELNKIELPLSIPAQRLQELRNLIAQRGVDKLIVLGRLGVWNELSTINSILFPFRDNAEDGTVKKFFTNQKLIIFKRGRKG